VLTLLIDQDFNHHILRGLSRRVSGLDALTAHQAGLGAATDSELLAEAAKVGRVIVTHDRKTMPMHAGRRIKRGEKVSGVIVVPRKLALLKAIEDLEIIVA
jgi:predicted nuclease of predicted toxin-antitoxin system